MFTPQPGQVDFTNIRWAPVMNCLVKFGEKMLLLQRSEKLNFYPGYWNGVSGFLDDQKSLVEKVHQELQEELGLPASAILHITPGQVFDQDEPAYKKTWIVHPVLVQVNTDQVKLDWEAGAYRWVTRDEAMSMKLLPGFDRVIAAVWRND